MIIDNLQEVAWVGSQAVSDPIRAIFVVFHGLGFTEDKKALDNFEIHIARRGGLVVFPYYGPWCWMNRQARTFVDDVVETVQDNSQMPPFLPIIAVGASMGGLSALLFARYSRHLVRMCIAIKPVCDLAFHFHERPDIPKTIRHAFIGYSESWSEVMVEHSPLHQVHGMPNIPYVVVHGDADQAVAKAPHSDRFVRAMRDAHLNVEISKFRG